MTSDLNQYYDALRKADAAGDKEAATKLTDFIKTRQAAAAPPVSRIENISKIGQREASGELNPVEGSVQAAGQIAKGINENVVEPVLKTAGNVISGASKIITPELNENLPKVGEAIAKSRVGQAVGGAVKSVTDKYSAWKQKHPDAAADLEAVGSVASLMPSGKATEAVGSAAGKAAVEAAAPAVDLAKTGMKARSIDDLKEAHEAIKDAGRASYMQSEALGAKIGFNPIRNLTGELDKVVPERNTAASRSLYSKTLKAIEDFKLDAAKGPMSLQTLDKHRQILGNISKDITNPNKMQEAERAGAAIDKIDEAVDRLTRKDIINQNIEAVDALKKGRSAWAKQKNFGKLVDIVAAAEGDGDKITKGFKTFGKKSKNLQGFTDKQISLIKKAGSGGAVEKIMSALGKFGIDDKDVSGRGIAKGLAYGLGGSVVGGPAVAGAAAVGTAAKYGKKISAKGRAEKALQAVEDR